MTDLPRYFLADDHEQQHPEGHWVKWADVSSRLQQLEQEKATLVTEKEAARLRAYRQARVFEPSMDGYSGAMATFRAAFPDEKWTGDIETLHIAQALAGVPDAPVSCCETLGPAEKANELLRTQVAQLEAALAETREALHQFFFAYHVKDHADASDVIDLWNATNKIQARVDTPGSSIALVPQRPSEPASTPSPVKE